MRLAYGIGGVDWQDRIDYPRMRRERLAKGQAAMKKRGIAACLLTRTDNIRYMTSVKGPFFANQLRYALAFAEHDPVMYELGDMLEHNRIHCTWIKPENWRFAYCWLNGIVGMEAAKLEAKRFAQAILKDLKDRGVHKEKLGIDSLDEAGKQALAEAGIETVGVMPALSEARRTKTPDEVLVMRMAISIAETGYANLCETLKLGMRERDVGAAALAAITRAGAESAAAGVRSGPNTFEVYHSGNSDRIIEAGDLLYMNTCSTTFGGYRVCIYRSFIAGTRPNDKQKDWYKRCRDRIYNVISEIKPGATTAQAAKRFLPASTWGYEAEQRLLVAEVGHGIGMTYEEPIISRIFSLEHPQTFEPGMVIAVEAREGAPGEGGVRLEEMVLVTDTGHEIMTHWPADEIVPVGQVI